MSKAKLFSMGFLVLFVTFLLSGCMFTDRITTVSARKYINTMQFRAKITGIPVSAMKESNVSNSSVRLLEFENPTGTFKETTTVKRSRIQDVAYTLKLTPDYQVNSDDMKLMMYSVGIIFEKAKLATYKGLINDSIKTMMKDPTKDNEVTQNIKKNTVTITLKHGATPEIIVKVMRKDL